MENGTGDDDKDLSYYLEVQKSNQLYNSSLSKWILASLIAVNAGPFFLVKEDKEYLVALRGSAALFAFGIAAAIVCGFCAWLNTGMREARAAQFAEDLISRRQDRALVASQAEQMRNIVVKMSYVLAILTGFGSLILFIVGVFHMARRLP